MSPVEPKLVIRLGSHAEKDYVIKMAKFLDGIMVAGNLIESTPGATGSLLIKFGGSVQKMPYFIDPMTYGFAEDLCLLKSEQKRKKKTVVDFKRSYKNLSARFGGLFEKVIARDSPILLEELRTPSLFNEIVSSVAEYQLNRIKDEFALDPELAGFKGNVPAPAAILAPYFHCRGEEMHAWLDLVPKFAKATVDLRHDIPVHAVVCASPDLLLDNEARKKLSTGLRDSGCSGVWLWLTGFNEHLVGLKSLIGLRTLTEDLSRHLKVHNMHGGLFNLALSKYGMTSTAHGVGYGEQKEITPIQVPAMPTVRYYLPAVGRRLGVPNIERTFTSRGVRTPDDFHKIVCDCAICKGVVNSSLSEFSSFGDTRLASPNSKRPSQTPAAAKRCRFHFMINRVKEVSKIRDLSVEQIIESLENANESWGNEPSLSSDLGFLPRWISSLRPPSSKTYEDAITERHVKKIAYVLGLTYEELCQLEWDLSTDESDDGVPYGYLVTIEDGPQDIVGRIKNLEIDFVRLAIWELDDDEADR